LSAGISEVIEMLMAKDPKARYRSCKDCLSDLQAVKRKQSPPLAHKDFGAGDIQQFAAAEAAVAPAEIPMNQSGQQPAFRQWLVVLLAILLAVSVVFNIVLLATRSG
ncbi:MAG: hypothetical protein NTV94_10770, partial [Planctomycetota bacterium]|nr:hypothetical protein [Planctomycetota bacterium]